jgi:hypothetical protein
MGLSELSEQAARKGISAPNANARGRRPCGAGANALWFRVFIILCSPELSTATQTSAAAADDAESGTVLQVHRRKKVRQKVTLADMLEGQNVQKFPIP